MTSLRQRMLEDMQVRNLSPHTQTSYVQQVSRFARHFGRSPDTLGPEEIRAYQLYLTNDRKLAPGSICIAVSALGSHYESRHYCQDFFRAAHNFSQSAACTTTSQVSPAPSVAPAAAVKVAVASSEMPDGFVRA